MLVGSSEHRTAAIEAMRDIEACLAMLPEAEQQAYRDAQRSVIDARRWAWANEGMRMIW